MKYTFGFIGTGNMGGALARAVVKAAGGANITVTDKYVPAAAGLASQIGATHAATSKEVAEKCDFIFLGVKPQVMADMLAEIAPALKARKDGFVLVSMAAGVAIAGRCAALY